MKRAKGFTLIEVLIVAGVIAILAVIAVPNYLEAQTRSKVSKTRNEMRGIASALEAYHNDWQQYPFDGHMRMDIDRYAHWHLPAELSTPVAYLTSSKVPDPFRADNIRYTNVESTWGTAFDAMEQPLVRGASPSLPDAQEEFGAWRLIAAGPDAEYGSFGWKGVSKFLPSALPHPYDPTNGTVSEGDIIRTHASPLGYLNLQ